MAILARASLRTLFRRFVRIRFPLGLELPPKGHVVRAFLDKVHCIRFIRGNLIRARVSPAHCGRRRLSVFAYLFKTALRPWPRLRGFLNVQPFLGAWWTEGTRRASQALTTTLSTKPWLDTQKPPQF